MAIERQEGSREHYQICIAIQAPLPTMVAQQTQKTASVNSALEDRTLRNIIGTDISRRQYTRTPSKVVVDICTCCASTRKARKFLLGFFLGSCFMQLQAIGPAARA